MLCGLKSKDVRKLPFASFLSNVEHFFGVYTGTVTPNWVQGDIGPCVPHVWHVPALDLSFS